MRVTVDEIKLIVMSLESNLDASEDANEVDEISMTKDLINRFNSILDYCRKLGGH